MKHPYRTPLIPEQEPKSNPVVIDGITLPEGLEQLSQIITEKTSTEHQCDFDLPHIISLKPKQSWLSGFLFPKPSQYFSIPPGSRTNCKGCGKAYVRDKYSCWYLYREMPGCFSTPTSSQAYNQAILNSTEYNLSGSQLSIKIEKV